MIEKDYTNLPINELQELALFYSKDPYKLRDVFYLASFPHKDDEDITVSLARSVLALRDKVDLYHDLLWRIYKLFGFNNSERPNKQFYDSLPDSYYHDFYLFIQSYDQILEDFLSTGQHVSEIVATLRTITHHDNS